MIRTHSIRILGLAALLTSACSSPRSPAPVPAPIAASPAPPAVEVEPTGSTPAKAMQPARYPQPTAGLLGEARRLLASRAPADAQHAAEHLLSALAWDPDNATVYWELGWAYEVLGDYEECLRAWSEVRRLDPHFPELDTYYPTIKERLQQERVLQALPQDALVAPETEPRTDRDGLRLMAVGDIQMGQAWPKRSARLPPKDGRALFAHTKSLLQQADITFGNLETVLADDGRSRKCGSGKKGRCYAFRVPSHYAQAVKEAGFDVLSIANNHTGDFGAAGRAATMAALDKVGLLHSGPVGDTAEWTQNGLRLGMVAFGTGAGLYSLTDIPLAQQVVAELARRCDVVIVSFHGGAEGKNARHVTGSVERFYGENRGDVQAFAHAVVDAGADLVLGHGPHVLRAMELYQGRLIAYSLGNFSAWHGFNLTGPLGRSVILDVTLAANGVLNTAQIHPLKLQWPGVPMPDPSRAAVKDINALSTEDLGQSLFSDLGRYPEGRAAAQ